MIDSQFWFLSPPEYNVYEKLFNVFVKKLWSSLSSISATSFGAFKLIRLVLKRCSVLYSINIGCWKRETCAIVSNFIENKFFIGH